MIAAGRVFLSKRNIALVQKRYSAESRKDQKICFDTSEGSFWTIVREKTLLHEKADGFATFPPESNTVKIFVSRITFKWKSLLSKSYRNPLFQENALCVKAGATASSRSIFC